MHEKAILKLDQAALDLVQALDTYGEELQPYLEPQHLASLQAEVVNLRRVLLGLEMGLLYQDWTVPAELLENVVSHEAIPVEEAAAHVVDLLNQHPREEDET